MWGKLSSVRTSSRQAIKIIAVFFPLTTSFLSSTRRLTREKRFILPWQSSIIEDNDVGNGKIKLSHNFCGGVKIVGGDTDNGEMFYYKDSF